MFMIITMLFAIPVGMFLMTYLLEGGDMTMGQFAWMLLKAVVKHS